MHPNTPTHLCTRALALAVLLSAAGCGNMFQNLVAKYGPTTDSKGSVELQEKADAGRALLAKGDYLAAIKQSPPIWAALSTSDSRKGGIATVYFRDFCDALYASESRLPAFEVATLFQLAVETFPSETWKEDFIKGDREKLRQRSAEASRRAKPELEALAAAAEKRGHVATSAMYLSQIARMYSTDAQAVSVRDAALGKLREKYTMTVAVKGDASLAKQIASAGDRPSRKVSDGADLVAEFAINSPQYDRTKENVTLTAKVIRDKKEVPDSRYHELSQLIEGEQKHIASLEQSIRAGTNVPSNSRFREDHVKKLDKYRAEQSKRSPTQLVDNVVDVSYPGIRDVLSASQSVSGKVGLSGEAPASVNTSVSAATDVTSHEGLAEARLAPQHPKLPPNGSLDGELLSNAAKFGMSELAKAYDRRLASLVKPLQAGDKDAKVEATAVLLALTGADADVATASILELTRMPEAKTLLRPASK